MALRQIDVYLPDSGDPLSNLTDEVSLIDRHTITLTDGRTLERLLVDETLAEATIDHLHAQLTSTDDFRIVVAPVDATLPPPEDQKESTPAKKDEKSTTRISREEVYQDMVDTVQITTVYYTLIALSVIVAAGGMLRDNTAVVIGAMVIAPLIGPNIALGLGTTLADRDLILQSLRINASGLLMGLALAFGMGLFLPVDPNQAEIALRTAIGLPDVALALAAGVAGTLAITQGLGTAIVGVMVAVALVPPLVAVGLLAGSGEWDLAYQAGLLLVTNVAGVNLAAVLTFLWQGLRPMSWYQAERAKRATRRAVAIWTVIVLVLATAIWMAG